MPLDPADGYPVTPPTLAIWAGGETQQARQFVIDMDIAMRRYYATNLENVAKTIYPMLYAEATFNGGRYTFCVNEHTTYVSNEVNPIYTQLKAIAHVPLAIYSILIPYAEFSENRQWVAPLEAYSQQVDSILERIDKLEFSGATLASSTNILTRGKNFIATTLASGQFTLQDYKDFCASISQDILVNQTAAAVDQVQVMQAYLSQWRSIVGQAYWDQMYVMCQCIWTVSQHSAHEQIIKSMMKPEFHETHVMVSEAATTLDDARLLLARIIADRVLAAAVFDKDVRPEFAQNIYSLSTERDLLAKSIEEVLGQQDLKSLCPLGHV